MDEIAAISGLTEKEIATILDIKLQNLQAVLPDQPLNVEVSERFLLLKNVLLHALDTFENRPSTVLSWLKTPIRELGNQTPLQVMGKISGFALVDDVLGRIDYGLPA